MSTVYGFNNQNDVDSLLHLLAESRASKSRSTVSPSRVSQPARYAKIKTLLTNEKPEHNNKEATGVEVVWDSDEFDFVEVTEKPSVYDDEERKEDSATVFATTNITSKTAMKVNDIVSLQRYPRLSDTSSWLVLETGKGAEFGTSTVTGEGEENNEYLVDVVPGNPQITVTPPEPDDVIKGVLYLSFGDTNAVAVGAKIFTILYASTKEVPEGEDTIFTYDCIPMETLYNLVAPPEEEEPAP